MIMPKILKILLKYYNDDSTVGGDLENLRAWWNELCRFGVLLKNSFC